MRKCHIAISNKLSELEKLTTFVEAVAKDWHLKDDISFHLNLALEEFVSNIIQYGYEENQAEQAINLEISLNEDVVQINITDSAREFNPLKVPLPDDLDKNVRERKVGGLGVFFIRSLMDSIAYERSDGKNILILTKKIT